MGPVRRCAGKRLGVGPERPRERQRNERQRQDAQRFVRLLSEREIQAGAERGKVDSGGRDLGQAVDLEQATGAALQAFEDGLYLVILDGEIRNAVAKYDLVEVVRTSNRTPQLVEDQVDVQNTLAEIQSGREVIRQEVLRIAQTRTSDLGIDNDDLYVGVGLKLQR